MEKSGDRKWCTNETVAVVTGANKSIGLEVVRHLAKKGITVVITACKQDSGLAATNSVVAEGYSNVHFHYLDVQSDSSVSDLAVRLKHKFNGIDILINNAGIAGEKIDWEFVASRGIDLETLLKLRNEALREQLSEVENLNEEEIDAIVNSYLNDVKSGQVEGKGLAYTVHNLQCNKR